MPQHSDKWRFAIGTTSRVPGSRFHYLIADFDEKLNMRMWLMLGVMSMFGIKYRLQETTHGWHLYTNIQMSFSELVRTLKRMRADPAWITIGKERGYYFLADKKKIRFNWKVEHMVIHHGQKKAQNTKASGSPVRAKGN